MTETSYTEETLSPPPATEYLVCLAIDAEALPATEAFTAPLREVEYITNVNPKTGEETSDYITHETGGSVEVEAMTAEDNPIMVMYADNMDEARQHFNDLMHHNRPNGELTLYEVEEMDDDKYSNYFDVLMRDERLDNNDDVTIIDRHSFAGKPRVITSEQNTWLGNAEQYLAENPDESQQEIEEAEGDDWDLEFIPYGR